MFKVYNAHPFQLLEITLVSAQDLAPISKSMRTYGVVWIHPERRLSTKVDCRNGHTNPQWNERFVFRVDAKFLNDESSAITIEIYAAAWLRDVLIGSVRFPISNLFPSTATDANSNCNNNVAANPNDSKMRFLALQIRRPSGRPQGILNLGVQLLDGTMRSMPLSTELSASGIEVAGTKTSNKNNQSTEEKTARLRRTQSDRTDFTFTEGCDKKAGATRGSLVNLHIAKEEGRGRGNINISGNDNINEGGNHGDGNEIVKGNGSILNGSLCTDVGPSASIVAAAIAQGLISTPANAAPQKVDGRSPVVDDWREENDSVEGLRTRLERWRAELPPVYDTEERRMRRPNRRQQQHRRQRRHEEGETGLFSCFGSIFGCQISITCGGGNAKRRHNSKSKVYH